MQRFTLLLAAGLVLTACATTAGNDTRLAQIDRLMQGYDGAVPGASLLVLRDGAALVRKSYGFADLEHGIAATPASNYRLASISKQFTAAAILLLVEDGKLDLDDSLRQWLPSLPASTDAITIHHLLSHSSGLIDYEELMADDTVEQISDADVLRMLSEETDLYFAPGSQYRYSNGGYVLLGLIVERASGKSLQDFLKQRIFQPLGMDNTLLYVHDEVQVPHRAYGYSLVDGHWTRSDQSPTSATRGDGGIYSSINDLAKWDAALYDERLLSDASRKLAFSPQVEVSGEVGVNAYGYGWRIGDGTLWHSGETMGFRNVIVRYPEQHLSVILLSNRRDPEPYRTALAVAELFMDD